MGWGSALKSAWNSAASRAKQEAGLLATGAKHVGIRAFDQATITAQHAIASADWVKKTTTKAASAAGKRVSDSAKSATKKVGDWMSERGAEVERAVKKGVSDAKEIRAKAKSAIEKKAIAAAKAADKGITSLSARIADSKTRLKEFFGAVLRKTGAAVCRATEIILAPAEADFEVLWGSKLQFKRMPGGGISVYEGGRFCGPGFGEDLKGLSNAQIQEIWRQLTPIDRACMLHDLAVGEHGYLYAPAHFELAVNALLVTFGKDMSFQERMDALVISGVFFASGAATAEVYGTAQAYKTSVNVLRRLYTSFNAHLEQGFKLAGVVSSHIAALKNSLRDIRPRRMVAC